MWTRPIQEHNCKKKTWKIRLFLDRTWDDWEIKRDLNVSDALARFKRFTTIQRSFIRYFLHGRKTVHPRCTFSGPMPGQIAFDFLSSAKRVNNRESNIARGWSYSQQSNLYLKKAALYSLENLRILWSCQPLISKGSLADRDVDLSYGAREVWFWHQICRYYTVCRHVEAYTLGRLSIDGFSFERVAQSNQEWIFSKLDSGFQSLVGFRIPSAGFRIPKPRIPDSTSKKFLDSGIRIPLHGANGVSSQG